MRRFAAHLCIGATTVLPLAIFIVLLVTSPREADSAAPATRGKCGRCHPEIAQEWLNSLHAKAFQDTHFTEAIKGEKDAESKCFTCHAPEALRVKGIGKTPGFRVDLRETGVDCMVCHTNPKGVVHAPFRSGAAPHDVEVDPQHKTEELCASCHGAFGTVGEFKQSKFAKEGQTCATCHMPKVKRAAAVGGKMRMVSSHVWKGGDDPETLKKAVKLDATVSAEGVVTAKATNIGAGHKFPTGTQFHQAVLVVTVTDAGGKEVFNKTELLADQTKAGGPDTRINAGETRTMTVPTNVKSGVFKVRVLYKRTSSIGDKDAPEAASAETRL